MATITIKPGTIVGRLTAIAETRVKGERAMLCRCECGTMKTVSLYNLKPGRTTSCGCGRRDRSRQEKVDVPPGTVFGHLAVIGAAGYAPSRDRLMLCGCECGNETIVKLNNLRNGHTKSCGCNGLPQPDLSELKPGEVPLYGEKGIGTVAIVDIADYDLVMQYRWRIVTSARKGKEYGPYASTLAGGSSRNTFMHRLLTGWELTDHIDGNGLNNRRSNLRSATQSQNMCNTSSRGGSSQFKGVSWVKSKEKWRAEIAINHKRTHLGYFTDEIKAALAYDAAAVRLHGGFARLNFPECSQVA